MVQFQERYPDYVDQRVLLLAIHGCQAVTLCQELQTGVVRLSYIRIWLQVTVYSEPNCEVRMHTSRHHCSATCLRK